MIIATEVPSVELRPRVIAEKRVTWPRGWGPETTITESISKGGGGPLSSTLPLPGTRRRKS